MKENIYRTARKKASEKNPDLKSLDTAQDIVAMAKVYDAPELCNYYCTNECPIDCNSQPFIYDDLDKISVRLMSALHFLDNANDRIFAILEDGQVTENEREEFENILATLHKISYSAGSLELWAKKHGFGDN